MKVKFLKPIAAVLGADGKVRRGVGEGDVVDMDQDLADSLMLEGYCRTVENPAEEPKPKHDAEIKKLSDIVKPRMDVEGEQVTKEEIADQEIVVRKFELRQSTATGAKEGDQYAIVQILLPNGEPGYLTIGAEQVVETLKQVEAELPLRAKLASRKNPRTKRTYWVLE